MTPLPVAEAVDVAIVGGGPVGMFCALELLAHGLDVVVVERSPTVDARLRARVLHSQTLALLDRRGLLAGLKPSEPRTTVHFAGLECIDLSLMRADHPYALFVQQQVLEHQLELQLTALGRAPRRVQTVIDCVERADGVDLTVAPGGSAEGTYAIDARMVLACDGGASGIRKSLDIPFDGSEPTFVAYQGLMTMHGGAPLTDGWHRTSQGMYVIGPGRRMALVDYGADALQRHDPGALEADFAEALTRVVGPDVAATEIESLTRFTDNSRIARRYRSKRVFLVGDAAHVHPPFAGQGLNLGLQDAVNLAWKIGAVLAGNAPESLLDTYEDERRPIADRVVELSLSQSALMRPDEQTTALRAITKHLLGDESTNRAIAELIGGITTRVPGVGDCDCAGSYARDEPLMQSGRATSLVQIQRENPAKHVVILGSGVDVVDLLVRYDGLVAVAFRSLVAPEALACGRHRLVRPDGYVSVCSAATDDVFGFLEYAGGS